MEAPGTTRQVFLAENGLDLSRTASIRRTLRAEKLVILLLLFILLTTATASVSAVLTGPDWSLLWQSLLFGMLLGWLFAVLHWPTWRAAMLLLILGVLFGLFFVGGLNRFIFAVIAELFRLAGIILTSFKVRGVDLSQLATLSGQVANAAGVITGRVVTWVRDLLNGQAAFDPVAANIVWNIVVWLAAAWAGWVVEGRRNALAAVLPVLILNLSTLSYGRYNPSTIYFLLGLTLVLIAIVQYSHYEQVWDETRVAYPARKSREIGQIALVLALLLVMLSAVVASNSLARIIQRTSTARASAGQSESGLAKSLGIVAAATPTPDSFSTLRSPGLPRELLIGAGPELSTEQVMAVRVTDLAALVQNGHLPPLYWRSFTYDIYTGHGWSSSPTLPTQYQAGQAIEPAQQAWHVLVQQQVSFVPGLGGVIYAAGEPVSADVATNAAWRSSNDLFGIEASNPSYEIQSLLPIATEQTLRQAGQVYPKWILQRYLTVPEEVPARVKELALQLTAAGPTPYDRAHAIEQYLRTFPYTLDVPRPPANQDLVDYFLFDLRKGYCDYYASAMVVLARAAGIPARLAVGYASGTYNLNSSRFIVTQADAHSWVEVYFPGIGWVPFEPTAGLPAIGRSTQAVAAVTPPAATPTILPKGNITTFSPLLVTSIVLAALFGLSFAAVVVSEMHLDRLPPRQAASEVYRRLWRYGLALRLQVEGGETPFEYSAALSRHITNLSRTGTLSSLSRQAIDDIQVMVNDIVSLSYQPASDGINVARWTVRRWRGVRWRLRWLWLIDRWLLFRSRLGYVIKGQAELPDSRQN